MNGILAVKNVIIDLLAKAAAQAQEAGENCRQSACRPSSSSIPRTPPTATTPPPCLKLARSTGMKPLDIAAVLVEFIPQIPEIKSVTVAPPGFINFTLSDAWITEQVEAVIESGECYGNIDTGVGKKVQIEYVSANPTGPIHVGHGRGAVLGSALAAALKAAGFEVQQEYYVNDAGNQVMSFKRSLYTRYLQQLGRDIEMPAEGYFGHYMIDLARDILQEEGERFLDLPEAEALEQLGLPASLT